MFQRVDRGFTNAPGGHTTGFADTERDDVVHRLDHVEEIANPRSRDIAHMISDGGLHKAILKAVEIATIPPDKGEKDRRGAQSEDPTTEY